MSADEEIRPTAASLVCAVEDHDAAAVAEILTNLDVGSLYALAVVLAASVDTDSALHAVPTARMKPAAMIDHALRDSAERFDTTIERILSHSRREVDCYARQVVMYALRVAGLSLPTIGAALDRHHTTVMYAVTRVGEDARLRRIANAVAEPITRERGLLDDSVAADVELAGVA